MRVTELETLLADYCKFDDINYFIHRTSVDELPDGNNGDVRMTKGDRHYHLYHNGWIDLGSIDDERVDSLQVGDFIRRDEAREVISDLSEEIFSPLTDDDIEQVLQGGA